MFGVEGIRGYRSQELLRVDVTEVKEGNVTDGGQSEATGFPPAHAKFRSSVRPVSPGSVISEPCEEVQESTSTTVNKSTDDSHTWLECMSSDENDDPLYPMVCVPLDQLCNDDAVQIHCRQDSGGSVFSDEFQEAYTTGNLHNFFWQQMVLSSEAPEKPALEWNGHRPLDPAYPTPNPRRKLSPRSRPIFTPMLMPAIQASPENDDIEIILQRVC